MVRYTCNDAPRVYRPSCGIFSSCVSLSRLKQYVYMDTELKKLLYALFGQFGRVLDVVCMKREELRGRAWIVFADVESATHALRAMQDFPFYGKEIKVKYARTKSDVVAKLDGTWRKDLRTRKEVIGGEMMEIDDDGRAGKKSVAGEKKKIDTIDVGEANKLLFVENLPEKTNEKMLDVLFKQFPGYVEARLVPGKTGIAFVEFETEQQASVAITGLQGFKITPQYQMTLTYAKK